MTTEVEPTTPVPVNVEPAEETVGDIMAKAKDKGLLFLVKFGGALVYVAGIIYAEVHALNLLSKGVPPDMRIWATVGIFAAGITALLFPIALKVWAIEARHRMVATIFYVIDFTFLAANAFIDFTTNTGGTLTGWALSYAYYVLPTSPIAVAAMWTIMWSLDPDVRDKILKLSLRAAMKEKMASRVAEAAKGQHVTDIVNAAAEREVERAMTELFGAPVTVYKLHREDEREGRDGWLQRFFGRLSRHGQSINSTATPSQLEQSDSSNNQNPQDGDQPNQ